MAILLRNSIFQKTYRDDPVAFIHDCIDWKRGESPTLYQDECLAELQAHRRIAARGPHGVGKTAPAAWAVLWFATTRENDDWKVPTTASAWRQLSHYLWPEVHKWARRLRWDRIGRPPFSERTELLGLSLKLRGGEAFALASDNSALIEGAHAEQLLYVFDEAKTIPYPTWDSAEGAFSIGECYWMAFSTPGEPLGQFYDIHARKPGYEDWWARHIKKEEAIAAGRISRAWVEQRKKQWGEESAVYQNRVEGEFASSAGDGVIPLAWIEQAVTRWHKWVEAGKAGLFNAVGVDVARQGEDKTVLALRFGNAIATLRKYSQQDTMRTADQVRRVLVKYRSHDAIIDVIGLGAGVVDRLRQQGMRVTAFNASEKSEKLDSSGELGFSNKRSAAWWNLREMLDPTSEARVALPDDDELIGDLAAPHWREMSGGRVQVESKREIIKRLGRSPDCGDAVVMAFYEPPRRAPLPQVRARIGRGRSSAARNYNRRQR